MSQFSHTQKHTLTIQPSLMPWLFDAAVSTAVVRPTNSQGKVVQGWDVFYVEHLFVCFECAL